MKKVLITGSSGRIGRALHWRLSPINQIVAIDSSPASTTSVIGDIRSDDLLCRHLEGVDTIFHAAALHAPHVGVRSERDFYEINVLATEKICKAALVCGVSKIIFTSTTALYGFANEEAEQTAWINEETTPLPKTIYHRTKLDAEACLQSFANNQLQVRVMRISRCFPEPANLMAIYRLHRGIDYRDVAEAHFLADQLHAPENYDTFVISGKTPFLYTDRVGLKNSAEKIIRQRTPRLAEEFDRRGWELPKSIDRVYDSSYAQQKLDWNPRRDAFALLNQYDQQDFETLPPL